MMKNLLRSALPLAAACVAFPAAAGSLNLAWAPSPDEVTAGYKLEVLTDDGRVVSTIDAKEATTAAVDHLADGQFYRFRVRPYDQWGNAGEPSAEVRTMPSPKVFGVDRFAFVGGQATFVLSGANVAPGARVVSLRPGMVVGSVQVLSDSAVRVAAAGPAASLAPLPGELVVHNPVRRSDAFVAAHPELLDVDHSGTVDAQDLGIVAALFGVDSRSPRYNPDADVNGDGLIDGEDASLVRARLAPDPEEQKAP